MVENPDCKIAVLDVDKEWGARGAGACDLSDPAQWPFAAPGAGIDGASALPPHHYQYSQEHWIGAAIRNSSRYTPDVAAADFVFVDMHCYHAAWMAWLHPLNEAGRAAQPSPEYSIKRALARLQSQRRCVHDATRACGRRRRGAPYLWLAAHGCAAVGHPCLRGGCVMSPRPAPPHPPRSFRETKGGDYALVHPAPLMKGLLNEEAACEDLASVLNMVRAPGAWAWARAWAWA